MMRDAQHRAVRRQHVPRGEQPLGDLDADEQRQIRGDSATHGGVRLGEERQRASAHELRDDEGDAVFTHTHAPRVHDVGVIDVRGVPNHASQLRERVPIERRVVENLERDGALKLVRVVRPTAID